MFFSLIRILCVSVFLYFAITVHSNQQQQQQKLLLLLQQQVLTTTRLFDSQLGCSFKFFVVSFIFNLSPLSALRFTWNILIEMFLLLFSLWQISSYIVSRHCCCCSTAAIVYTRTHTQAGTHPHTEQDADKLTYTFICRNLWFLFDDNMTNVNVTRFANITRAPSLNSTAHAARCCVIYIYNHVCQTDLKQRNSVRLAEDRMNRLTYYMLCSDCVKTR